MSDSPPLDLAARLEELGRSLGQREAAHAADLEGAREQVERLHAEVSAALERFHAAASQAGAPHLRIDQSDVRIDHKHLRSVEFELSRGRHRAIVVAKSRGEVTLVGPFRTGKTEGPCQSFAFDAKDAIADALESFLADFIEEAASP